ncbi:hypothetical protein EK21DRAFT_115478 [Setomelanomma holmii]|uniref:Uncharacterized protein n=1 Tax=Setomelanomma holmii TaxID=210430 RepID=A0A9P4LJL7_9PLEO|nr:hypothetical protein EK21DRAFT_115478 [Setomelanomma holmii]
MVSKQQKYLRQQAISRAEKYKEEQAAKVVQTAGTNDIEGLQIPKNPRKPSLVVESAPNRQRTQNTAPRPNKVPAQQTNMPLLIEKKPLHKALAKKQKQRYVPILLSEYVDDATHLSPPRFRGRPRVQPSRADITGGVSREVVEDPGCPLDIASTVVDTTILRSSDATGTLAAESVAVERIPCDDLPGSVDKGHATNEVTPQPFFRGRAGAGSTFTFDSKTAFTTSASSQHMSDPPKSVVFVAPPSKHEGALQITNQDQVRTIFDATQSRASTKPQSSEDTCSTDCDIRTCAASTVSWTFSSLDTNEQCKSHPECSVAIHASGHLAADVLGCNVTKPTNSSLPISKHASHEAHFCHAARRIVSPRQYDAVFIKLLQWTREELEHPQSAALDFAAQQTLTEAEAQRMRTLALVIYQPPATSPACIDNQSIKLQCSDNSLISQRIFFADAGGHTRLVDLTQTLYEVNVTMDDGASDFDSVASPMKIEPRPTPYYEDNQSSSSEEDDVEDCDLDLDDFQHFGCMWITESPRHEGNSTPATTPSFSDDEDIIDPCLVFGTLEVVTSVGRAEHLSKVPSSGSLTEFLDEDAGTYCEDVESMSSTYAAENIVDQIKIDFDPIMEINSSAPIRNLQSQPHVDGLPVIKQAVSTASETYFRMDSTSTPQGGCLTTKASAALDASLFKAEVAGMSDIRLNGTFSSDWASELMRLVIGTESLFTFLDNLNTDKDGSVNLTTIVTTFLRLVDLEREKLGRRKLPVTCDALSVMASQIIPFTIFLGTTSLASFLSHFAFSADGKTTLDEVYRVFKLEQAEDSYIQTKAAKGIMGELSRSLGKLATF